jgi:predicted dehydrogenase
MPKRIAAIDVSHWHSAYASYLRILRGLGRDIVGVSDRDERIARDRAERFGGTPFTDYRRMVETTRPDFVIALGRHCDIAADVSVSRRGRPSVHHGKALGHLR